jgi:hypothetical protein
MRGLPRSSPSLVRLSTTVTSDPSLSPGGRQQLVRAGQSSAMVFAGDFATAVVAVAARTVTTASQRFRHFGDRWTRVSIRRPYG